MTCQLSFWQGSGLAHGDSVGEHYRIQIQQNVISHQDYLLADAMVMWSVMRGKSRRKLPSRA